MIYKYTEFKKREFMQALIGLGLVMNELSAEGQSQLIQEIQNDIAPYKWMKELIESISEF